MSLILVLVALLGGLHLLRRGEATVKVRSLNVGDGAEDAKLRDLRRFARDGTDVILGQEFGDRYTLVERFLAEFPTWRVLWGPDLAWEGMPPELADGDSNSERKTPILYNSATLRLGWWQQIIAVLGGRWLGPRGAGPSRAETKRLNQARFVLRANGRKFKVLNHHAYVHAFSNKVSDAERARRRKAWTEQITVFFQRARATLVVVLGGGDWNAHAGNDALEDLRAALCPDWVWVVTGPTHGGAGTIDMLGHRRSGRVRVVDSGVDETHGSRTRNDHRSPYAVFALTKPRLRRRR